MPTQSQVYKWVDEKGVTHYSDKPPPKDKALQIPAQSGAPPSGAERNWKEKEREFQERQSERKRIEAIDEERKADAERRARRAKCQFAKFYLDQLEKRGLAARLPPGKTSLYIEEVGDLERAIEEARSAVRTWCAEEKE